MRNEDSGWNFFHAEKKNDLDVPIGLKAKIFPL